MNTKEAKGEEEDEIFKSDWSQRGLKALGNNQTTKHTSVHDCLHKTYTHQTTPVKYIYLRNYFTQSVIFLPNIKNEKKEMKYDLNMFCLGKDMVESNYVFFMLENIFF